MRVLDACTSLCPALSYVEFVPSRYFLREEDMEQIETSDNPKLTLERLLVSRDLPCAMRSMQQESKSIHLNTFYTVILE